MARTQMKFMYWEDENGEVGLPFVFSHYYSTIIQITSTLIFLPVTLEFLELSCRNRIKRDQEAQLNLPRKRQPNISERPLFLCF